MVNLDRRSTAKPGLRFGADRLIVDEGYRRLNTVLYRANRDRAIRVGLAMMIAASCTRVAVASSEPSAVLCERTAVNYLQQCLVKQREDETLSRTSPAECWVESQAVYDACQQSLLQPAAQSGDLAPPSATPRANATTSTAAKTNAATATHSTTSTPQSATNTPQTTTPRTHSTTPSANSTTPSANSTKEQERVREARRIREIM
ncbi:hypothetical protein G8770_21185 [Aestuariicella hydrocarbonica]|uniref:Uncharacterized protein n=1 Tax=Pseudomaricurvus hydrocarbonicus TaxID=1470433 RepID=A0A9E5T235_9GAMM|nr:hypothetical protein [Aestuariicella hydrocarbonica]NHO68070.1 hypothetical protein [Aestuariicella hydrocarbonica]